MEPLPEHIMQELHKLTHKMENYSMNLQPGSKKGDNYLGQIIRLEIKSPTKTLNLIIKIASNDPKFRAMAPIEEDYKREYYLYKTILPTFEKLQNYKPFYPKVYAACAEPEKEFLIMGDLLNYKLADRKQTLNLPHCELFIEKIALLHALSLAMRYKNPIKFQEFCDNTPEFFLRSIDVESFREYAKKVDSVKDLCVDKDKDPVIWEKLVNLGDGIVDNLLKFTGPEENDEISVIIHGDCWSNNLLFKYENLQPVDLYLVDFQESRSASPVWDLATFMCASMDYQTLTQSFDHLVQTYHTNVTQHLHDFGIEKEIFAKAKLLEHFQKYFKYGVAFSFQLIPLLMQDEESNVGIDAAVMDQEGANGNFLAALDQCCKANEGDEAMVERLSGVIRFAADRNFI